MNYSTYCKTCGAIDSMLQTSDNEICGECGDTEGLITDEDYTEQEWEEITNG